MAEPEVLQATYGVGGTPSDSKPKDQEKPADVPELPRKTEETAESVPADAEPESQDSDSVEAEARKMGWRPKEEFDGEGKEWVDANEFVARAPLYKAIASSNQKIKNQEKAIETLKKHYEEVREGIKQQADKEIAELKVKLQEAAKLGDADEVTKIHEELVTKTTPKKEEESTTEVAAEAFNTWLEENQWYQSEKSMQRYADRIARAIAAENMDASGNLTIPPARLYGEVEDEVRDRFPDYFKPGKSAVTKVGTNSNRQPPEDTGAYRDMLTPEQRKVCADLVRQGVMTEKEYYNQLKEAGYLENQ